MCRHAVAIVPLLLTAPAQEFSCWPFKPNPPAGCRGEAHCACDSGRCQRVIMAHKIGTMKLLRLCAGLARDRAAPATPRDHPMPDDPDTDVVKIIVGKDRYIPLIVSERDTGYSGPCC